MADPVFAKAMELYVAWVLADGVAKEAAWAAFVRFLAANPLVLETVIGTFNAASASSAAFAASLRVAVQRAMQAAATRAGAELLAEQLVTTELRAGFLAQRVAQAFGKTPKVPISPRGKSPSRWSSSWPPPAKQWRRPKISNTTSQSIRLIWRPISCAWQNCLKSAPLPWSASTRQWTLTPGSSTIMAINDPVTAWSFAQNRLP